MTKTNKTFGKQWWRSGDVSKGRKKVAKKAHHKEMRQFGKKEVKNES